MTNIDCTELKDGRIELSFPFNRQIIEEIKKTNGRKYNPDKKTWIITTNGLSDLLSFFQNSKINFILPPDFSLDSSGLKLWIENEETEYGVVSKIQPSELPFLHDKSYQRLAYIRNPSSIYRIKKLLENNGYKVQDLKFGREKTVQLKPNINLYPYQRDCVNWFKENDYSGIMALDMGLGKTFTSLMCFHESDAKNLMIIAPAPLLLQWQNVIKENFGAESTIVSAKTKKEKRRKLLEEEPIVITSYDILLREEYAQIEVDMLIIDEIQKVKNWTTKRAQALHNIVSKFRLGLTGTPVENKLEELFNISDQCIPAYYGSKKVFYSKYTTPGPRGKAYPLETLYQKNKGLLFRITKEKVKDQLPKLRITERFAYLSQAEKEFMRDIETQDKEKIGIISELKVHASNPAIYMDLSQSSKEKLLEELLIDELENKKVVIFTQYAKNISRFKKIANKHKIKALYLSGGNSKDLEKIRDKFVEEDYQLLFLTDVGQYGLDKLQIADTLVNFDLPWNPAMLSQRIGRVHRLGSEHEKAFVINLVSVGTLDDYLIKILNGKIEISTIAIEGVKKFIADKLKLKDKELKI